MKACQHRYKLSNAAELATCQLCGKVIRKEKTDGDRLRMAHQRDVAQQRAAGK